MQEASEGWKYLGGAKAAFIWACYGLASLSGERLACPLPPPQSHLTQHLPSILEHQLLQLPGAPGLAVCSSHPFPREKEGFWTGPQAPDFSGCLLCILSPVTCSILLGGGRGGLGWGSGPMTSLFFQSGFLAS